MNPPLRLGLIGCGRLAELGYLPALAGLEGVALSAVADPDPARRARLVALAREPKPTAHASAGELIGGGEVDAVVVASPPTEHLWQAELAAGAGLGVLVEKPPAPTGEGAERLAALDPAPWIGFNRRFQHANAIAAAAAVAAPLVLELVLDYRRRSWRPVLVADDVLVDLGPHLVDLALLIGGAEGARVRAARATASTAELELESVGATARIRCANDRPYRELLTVHAAGGERVAASRAGGLRAAVADRLPGAVHPLVGSIREQLTAFAAAVGGAEPGLLATAADGARAMQLVDDARALAGWGAP